MLRAALAARDEGEAAAQAEWLASHRGRAYVERSMADLALAVNVADTTLALLARAEIAQRQGDREEADRFLERFKAAWPVDSLSPDVAKRVRAQAAPAIRG
jgi:uncharacterized protein HemY